MMDFGDVILRTLFPSFMTIQACTELKYSTVYVILEGSRLLL